VIEPMNINEPLELTCLFDDITSGLGRFVVKTFADINPKNKCK